MNAPDFAKAKVAFFFLLVFTSLLFARPEDFVVPLRSLPLARIIAVCAGIAYLGYRFQGGATFFWTTEIKLILGLTFLFAAGVPFSVWRSNSLDILVNTWLKTLIIFILISQTASTLGRIRKLLWVIILSELVVSALSIKYQGMYATEYDVRIGGVTVGFVSGNYLGIAAATVLPYISVLLLRSRSVVKCLLLVSTFGALMWMVALTASRGNLLCLLASLVFNWLIVVRRTRRGRLLTLVFVLLLIPTVLSAPGVFWERISTLWGGSGNVTTLGARSAEESQHQRHALFNRSIEYTLEKPIFGVGLGNFQVVSGSRSGKSTDWKTTHNTFTQISSEAGLPALFVSLVLLFVSVKNMKRVADECGDDPELAEAGMLARATMASILSFMIGGVFASLAYDYYLYYLIGLGVALQAIVRKFKKTNTEFSKGFQKSFAYRAGVATS